MNAYNAIRVKFAGPTDTRGARYIATNEAGQRAAVEYDYALGAGPDNAVRAAVKLREREAAELAEKFPRLAGHISTEPHHVAAFGNAYYVTFRKGA